MSSYDKLVCERCFSDRGFIQSHTIVAHFPLLDNKRLPQDIQFAFIMLIKSGTLITPKMVKGSVVYLTPHSSLGI